MVHKINFENLPQAVEALCDEIAEIKNILKEKQAESKSIPKRVPIGIDEVCHITGKAKPTIYALVRKREITSYKRGKKLYFYEDEILAWIESGKRKTFTEFSEEMDEDCANCFHDVK